MQKCLLYWEKQRKAEIFCFSASTSIIYRIFAKKETSMNITFYRILQILIWLIGFIFVAAISYICYTLGTSLK